MGVGEGLLRDLDARLLLHRFLKGSEGRLAQHSTVCMVCVSDDRSGFGGFGYGYILGFVFSHLLFLLNWREPVSYYCTIGLAWRATSFSLEP